MPLISTKKSIDYAKTKYPEIKFICEDITKGNNYKFNIIVCSEVLEHLRNPSEFLNSMKKMLKPNGIIIITIPNGFGPWELFLNMPLDIVRYIVKKIGLWKYYRE